jgi:hypothetical protein
MTRLSTPLPCMGKCIFTRKFRHKKATQKVALMYGVPKGIRTPVAAVKGQCPRPLDDGDNI